MYKDSHGNLRLRHTSEILDKMITAQGFKNMFFMIMGCIILAILTFIFLSMSFKVKIIITGCVWILLILYAIFSKVLDEE